MLAHMKTCADPKWKAVVEARMKGDHERAEKLAKKAMGIKGKPMPEERREHCRQYKLEHKDEIKDRAKQNRVIRRRTRQLVAVGKGPLRRKR